MAIAGAYRGVGKVREQDAVVLHGMHAPYGLAFAGVSEQAVENVVYLLGVCLPL